ncbi:MAG TPA: hypothetical protein VFF06_01535 [Polyangia bacterium]|nr:hypothetical protein [Polyangia bacterium]
MTRAGGIAALLMMQLVASCGSDATSPSDMQAGLTCSQLCSEYLVCEQQADGGFMGSMNALVPCENACFSAAESVRDQLRTCATMSCNAFIACAVSAGLKLGAKPMPDLAATD